MAQFLTDDEFMSMALPAPASGRKMPGRPLSDDEFMALGTEQQTAVRGEDRSDGMLGDVARAVNRGATVGMPQTVIGLNEFAKSLPIPANLVAGAARRLLPDSLTQAIDEKNAALTRNTLQVLEHRGQRLGAEMTPESQAAQKKQFFTDEASWDRLAADGLAAIPGKVVDLISRGEFFGDAWTDPRKITLSAAESAPESLLTMAPAAVVARGAAARAVQAAIARGATQEAAERIGIKAAEKTAGLIGGAAEGLAGAGGQWAQTYQAVRAMPVEQLSAHPQFREYYASLPADMPEQQKVEAAHEAMARNAAHTAAAVAGAADALFGYFGDKYIGGAAAGKGTRAGAAVRGVVSETPTELLQSGSEQLGENLGVKLYADESRPLMKDVGEQAVSGALSGGLLGGAMGAGLHRNAPQAEAPDQPAGLLPAPQKVVFPDGTVANSMEDVERYLAQFPEEERVARRAQLLGYGRQEADPEPAPEAPALPNPGAGADSAARETLEAGADGTVRRRGESAEQLDREAARRFEQSIAELPEDQQIEARARYYGYGAQPADAVPAERRLAAPGAPRTEAPRTMHVDTRGVAATDPGAASERLAEIERDGALSAAQKTERAAQVIGLGSQETEEARLRRLAEESNRKKAGRGKAPAIDSRDLEQTPGPGVFRRATEDGRIEYLMPNVPGASLVLSRHPSIPGHVVDALDVPPGIKGKSAENVRQLLLQAAMAERPLVRRAGKKFEAERALLDRVAGAMGGRLRPGVSLVGTGQAAGRIAQEIAAYKARREQERQDQERAAVERQARAERASDLPLTDEETHLVEQLRRALAAKEITAEEYRGAKAALEMGEADEARSLLQAVARPDVAREQAPPVPDIVDEAFAESRASVRNTSQLSQRDDSLPMGGAVEVAPNPADKQATKAFADLPIEQRARITQRVAGSILPRLFAEMGLAGRYILGYTTGGYLGRTNPSVSITFDADVSYEQAREAMAAAGTLLNQQSVVVLDESVREGKNVVGVVRLETSRPLSTVEAQALYDHIYAATGGKVDEENTSPVGGYTAKDGELLFLNFSGLSDEQLRSAIRTALAEFDGFESELDITVRTDRIRSELVFTDERSADNGEGASDMGSAQAAGRAVVWRWAGWFHSLQAEGNEVFRRALQQERRAAIAERRGSRADGRGEGDLPAPARENRPGVGRDTGEGTPSYGEPREGAISVTGIHYSKGQRSVLISDFFGTGTKGAEATRLAQAQDARLRSRTYFYVNEGQGVSPEEGVGSHAHRVTLNNLYDAAADPLGLVANSADNNAFESAVLDAGFDGYYSRAGFGKQGVVVIIGRHAVPVEYLGTGAQAKARIEGTPAPVKPAESEGQQLASAINGNASLPAGEVPASRWIGYLKNLASGIYDRLESIGLIDWLRQQGDERIYRSDVAAQAKRLAGRHRSESRARRAEPAPITRRESLRALRRRAEQMLGRDARIVTFVDQLFSPKDGAPISGLYARDLITVAMSADDAMGTLDHETMHHAMEVYYTPAQRQVLRVAFKPGGALAERVRAALRADGQSAVAEDTDYLARDDEYITFGFQYWKRGAVQFRGQVGQLFQMFADFLERVRNWLRGAGFNTAEDLFRALDEGRLAPRQAPAESTTKESRQTPDYSRFKGNTAKEAELGEHARTAAKKIMQFAVNYQQHFKPVMRESFWREAKETFAGLVKEAEKLFVSGRSYLIIPLPVSATPEVLQMLGLPQRWIMIHTTELHKLFAKHGSEFAEVGATPAKLIEWMRDPMAVLDSKRGDHATVIMPGIVAQDGRHMILVLKPGEARYAGLHMRANMMVTAHLKPLDTILADNKLIYLKSKNPAVAGFQGQMRSEVGDAILGRLYPARPSATIRDEADLVKWIEKHGGIKESRTRPGAIREELRRYKEKQAAAQVKPKTLIGRLVPSYERRAKAVIDALDHFLDPLGKLPDPDTYLTERYKTLGAIARYEEIAKDIYDALAKASKDDAKALYNYLTTAGASTSAIKDQTLARKAVEVKGLIDRVGQALVKRGLLSQEAYERHKDSYLPRLYLKYLLDDSQEWRMGTGRKTSDQGYLKQRKDIPEEVRRVFLGEVQDPAFLSAVGITRAMRDLFILHWLEQISQKQQWVLPQSLVEWNGKKVSARWLQAEADRLRRQADHYDEQTAKQALALAVQMDEAADKALADIAGHALDDYKQVPDSHRYGMLRGMWVRKEIHSDIVGLGEMRSDGNWIASLFGYGGAGTKLTQLWKAGKVSLNPAAQIRNFVSNMVLLQLSGVPLHRIPVLFGRAVREIANDGTHWQVAKKYGVTESTFSSQELFRMKKELLDLEERTRGLGPFGFIRKSASWIAEIAGNAYEKAEAVGKTMKIIDAMEREKLDEAQAALAAQKWLFDYSLIPNSVRYARNMPVGGAPFLTFWYKAAPRLVEVMLHHPQRLLPWVLLWWGLGQLAASGLGADEEELKAWRKSLPEYMRNKSHLAILPYRDAQGRIQVADLGYFFPWTMFLDAGGALGRGDFTDLLRSLGLLGGPMTDLIIAMRTGKDPFTGRDIMNEGDPPARKAAALAAYLYDMAAPPPISTKGPIAKLVDAEGGTTDKYGYQKVTTGQALLGGLGFTYRSFDPELSRAENVRRAMAEIRQVQSRMRQQLQDQSLAAEQQDRLIAEYVAEMERRQAQLSRYIDETEPKK